MSELVVRPHGRRGQVCAQPRPAAESWTLNRPTVRNALSPTLVASLRRALEQAEKAGTQVVVLRGEGPSFCAGADLAHLSTFDDPAGPTPREFFADIWELTIAIERSPVVFVAAIEGHAVAGGLELALACDVVVAAQDALIGDGHVKNNLMPGGGASVRMERALGSGTARWLALSGELLRADDAGFSTWIRRTAPAADLDDVVDDVVGALLAVPAVAQGRYKALLAQMADRPRGGDMDLELDTADRHWFEQDVPGALRRFLGGSRVTKNREAS